MSEYYAAVVVECFINLSLRSDKLSNLQGLKILAVLMSLQLFYAFALYG